MISTLRAGFTTFATPDWTAGQVAEFAAVNGYQTVELRFLEGGPLPLDAPDDWYRGVREQIASRGLDVCCVGSGARLAVDDDAERRQHVADLVRFVDIASFLSAPLVRFFGLGVPGLVPADERQIEHAAAALREVVPVAEHHDIGLVVETHDVFAGSRAVQALLEAVSSAAVGVLWDFLHGLRAGESLDDQFDAFGGRIRHVHMKDARRQPDGTWQDVPPGSGDVPLGSVTRHLRRRGGDVALSLEWEGDRASSREILAAFPRQVAAL